MTPRGGPDLGSVHVMTTPAPGGSNRRRQYGKKKATPQIKLMFEISKFLQSKQETVKIGVNGAGRAGSVKKHTKFRVFENHPKYCEFL